MIIKKKKFIVNYNIWYFIFKYIYLVWDNVYGFDFRCMKSIALKEPLVDIVDSNQVITKSDCIKTIDINTCISFYSKLF